MRKHVIAMAGILVVGLAGLAQGAFIESSPVPWWTGTDGNPYTAANGNQWGCYQVDGSSDTWSNWKLMGWDGGSWVGPNSGGGRPAYSPGSELRDSGSGYGNKTPSLTFKADTMGKYSWYGSLVCTDWGQNEATQVTFGKFDGSNNWTQLYQTNVAHYGTLDLSSIPQLQNIPLTPDDKLVLIGRSTGYYSYGSVYPQSAGIGFVPVPVMMGTVSLAANGKDSAGTYSAATSYVWNVSGDLDWMLARQGDGTIFGHQLYGATMNPNGQYFQVGTPAYLGFDIGANLTSSIPQQAGAHDGAGENAHFYYGTGLTNFVVNPAYTDQTGYAGLIWFYNPSYQSTGMTYTFKAPASRFRLHHNFNLGAASPDQSTLSIKINGFPVNIGTQSSVPFNGSDFPTNNYELINAVLTFDNLTAGDDVTITHVGTSIGWQGARLVAVPGPVTGDVNNDGLVDALDIDALSAALKAGSTDLKYDLNSDAAVTSADKDYLVRTILHTQYGDATLDKKVDVSDLGVLAANYGTTSGAIWSKGDFTGDGKVDVSDLGVLAANYGFVSGKAAQAMDIQQDMKALGLSIGQDDLTAAQEPAPTGSCQSAGLPLIAGVCLAAMLLLNGFKGRE